MPPQVYRPIEGIRLSYYFRSDKVHTALAYKPQPDDVFIVSYPKCGATWVRQLLFAIFTDGAPPRDIFELFRRVPFLESSGVEGIEHMPRPGAIKTHFTFGKHPYSKNSKYIYIARNPYDCCVSYYYHTKSFPAYFFQEGTFDEFFEMFVGGQVEFGDYFDHLLSWYEHRHDANVLLLTYEGLKRDTKTWLFKIADFLGREHGEKLRNDPGLLNSILDVSSLENMRRLCNTCHVSTENQAHVNDEAPGSHESHQDKQVTEALKKPRTGEFVRKGTVGDWRNHFSPEQEAKMRSWIGKRAAGSDVMQMWDEDVLP